MGSLTKAFKADSKKESDGQWFEILKNDDGSMAKIKLRRIGPSNKEYQRFITKANKKLRMLRGSKEEMQVRELREAFIETCLVDWENIENINETLPGQAKEPYMPCTKDNARKLLESLPDLFDYLLGEAMELENFLVDANEQDAKNSFPSSNTV